VLVCVPKSKALEHLSLVTDGSEEHKVVYGYYTNNLIALTKDKIPIFLYSKVYYPPANKAYTGFKTKENLNGIKDVEASLLDKQLLFLYDSGYDNYNYIKHFCDNNDFFIIRSSGLRDFYLNGNNTQILFACIPLINCLNTKICINGKQYL
jgi:hypothetical protein